ncbi:hypothetical protein [Streptomyces sp. NPDC002550]
MQESYAMASDKGQGPGHSSAGSLITVGSSRQSQELHHAALKRGWRVDHVEVKAGDLQNTIRDHIAERCVDVSDAVLVNHGRSSDIGSVVRIAQACDAVASGHVGRVQVFGPSGETARVLDNKWEAHLLSRRAGLAAVRSTLVRAQDLRRVAPNWASKRVVIKRLNETGGRGMVGGALTADLFDIAGATYANDESLLLADFADGYELSLKGIVYESVYPVSAVLKEVTTLPVVHGDWKVKVGLPLPAHGWAFGILRRIAEISGVSGYLSIEGIWQPDSGEFLISEIAPRRTGSYVLADSVSSIGSVVDGVLDLLEEAAPLCDPTSGLRGATLPLQDSPAVQRAVEEGRRRGVVREVDWEDLDTGRRLRVHLGPWKEGELDEGLNSVGDIFGQAAAHRVWHLLDVGEELALEAVR